MNEVSCGDYTFREGRKGDKTADGFNDTEDLPNFVLEFKGKQVIAAHTFGSKWHIFLIKSFEKGKGHGTKFLELWEKAAKENDCTELCVSHVESPTLEHILGETGFQFVGYDNCSEKKFIKQIN